MDIYRREVLFHMFTKREDEMKMRGREEKGDWGQGYVNEGQAWD